MTSVTVLATATPQMTKHETASSKDMDLREQIGRLQSEKDLFFDLAYRTYTALAEIADQSEDETIRRRIHDAISELGLSIGRSEQRERPR